jgi:hypothetical protein
MTINTFCCIFSQTLKSLTFTNAKTQGNKKQREYRFKLPIDAWYLFKKEYHASRIDVECRSNLITKLLKSDNRAGHNLPITTKESC